MRDISFGSRPEAVTDHLGGNESIALLSNHTRAYPVEGRMDTVSPSVPLDQPNMGDTKYFVYHSVKTLAIGGSTVEDTACGGRFCDRQVLTANANETVQCGCMHKKDDVKVVTVHNVVIPCETHLHTSGAITVNRFRSWRFDQLLFKGDSRRIFKGDVEVKDPISNHVLRERVQKLVALVNGANGWTIVGWVRTGRVKDESEEGNQYAMDIASEDLKPHITYLQPTDPKDLEDHKDEYNKVLITESNYRKDMKFIEDKRNLEQKQKEEEMEIERKIAETEERKRVEEAKKARKRNLEEIARRSKELEQKQARKQERERKLQEAEKEKKRKHQESKPDREGANETEQHQHQHQHQRHDSHSGSSVDPSGP